MARSPILVSMGRFTGHVLPRSTLRIVSRRTSERLSVRRPRQGSREPVQVLESPEPQPNTSTNAKPVATSRAVMDISRMDEGLPRSSVKKRLTGEGGDSVISRFLFPPTHDPPVGLFGRSSSVLNVANVCSRRALRKGRELYGKLHYRMSREATRRAKTDAPSPHFPHHPPHAPRST